ncbi:phage baseplate protein [[Actinobacillus] muris]|uniref:Phage baseplate protein n=1 Tax=Muribacter muris TaxID=67855 RepID=A0A0J5P6E0_9PAST|nr:baseplate J/gp47 family protein [Muribacter muris]KMK51948.1 phage baseplate protein [[Actinobacillus] muris] [Muribacter muris]
MNRFDIQVVPEDVKQVLADSIARYERDTGKTLQPAQIERLIINVYAFRETLLRKGINEAFRQTFPQTATGIALDLCGESLGCYRLKDKPARTILRFSLAGEHASILIPKGTQVAVSDELYFSTLNDDVITPLISYVDIEAECNQQGVAGNGWELGRVNKLLTPLNSSHNVDVANIDTPSGGLVQEEDDDYRKRILAAPEAFSTCGSVAAYDYHARAVSQAIADVNISTPRGGLVRVAVLTKTGLPDARLLNDIRRHLSGETLRPLCDTVEVIAPTQRNYTIHARLTLLDGYREDIVIAKAREAVQRYLSDKTKKLGLDIVPSAIISALRVEGVYDVNLVSPAKTVIANTEWANCIRLNIDVLEARADG